MPEARWSTHPLCLIVGSGPTVWDDVEAFWAMEPPGHDVCCVNHIGTRWPCSFRHWMSLHGALLSKISRDRRPDCGEAPMLHSNKPQGDAVLVWRYKDPQGSSGLFALHVALTRLGYKRAVLAGIPIADEGQDASYATNYLQAWRERAPSYGDSVRSMSGNTNGLFGAPTKEWLYGEVR